MENKSALEIVTLRRATKLSNLIKKYCIGKMVSLRRDNHKRARDMSLRASDGLQIDPQNVYYLADLGRPIMQWKNILYIRKDEENFFLHHLHWGF